MSIDDHTLTTDPAIPLTNNSVSFITVSVVDEQREREKQKLDLKHSIILGPVYFPPKSVTVLDKLQDIISEIRNSHPTAKLFLGDNFNSPGINWHRKTLSDSYVSVSFREKLHSLKWQRTFYH